MVDNMYAAVAHASLVAAMLFFGSLIALYY
jgi:hypothetical protein